MFRFTVGSLKFKAINVKYKCSLNRLATNFLPLFLRALVIYYFRFRKSMYFALHSKTSWTRQMLQINFHQLRKFISNPFTTPSLLGKSALFFSFKRSLSTHTVNVCCLIAKNICLRNSSTFPILSYKHEVSCSSNSPLYIRVSFARSFYGIIKSEILR